jgi:hypothetical protein
MELRKTTDQQAQAKSLDSARVGLGAARPQNGTIASSGKVHDPKALQRPAHADRIELSEAARNHMATDVEGDALRANLVTELRSAYQDGSLMTQERIEKAAHHLLGA